MIKTFIYNEILLSDLTILFKLLLPIYSCHLKLEIDQNLLYK